MTTCSTRSRSSNKGTGQTDVIYQFRFHTKIRNTKTFLYNTGPIGSTQRRELEPPAVLLGDPGQERRHHGARPRTCACPPVNVGTAQHARLRATSPSRPSTRLGRRTVFAGQRADAFHVDLGSIFDLGTLRPFQGAHLIPSAAPSVGVDATKTYNVHSIALQVPITRGHPARRRTAQGRVRGARRSSASGRRPAAASRASSTRRPAHRSATARGSRCRASATRCSTRSSCRWPRRTSGTSATRPATTRYAKYVDHPELAKLLPVLYPGVFPQPGEVHQAAGRPGRDPAHRDPATASCPGSRTTPDR